MTTSVTKATPSTIIWIPSVDFQGFKSWHLGIDNYVRMQKVNGVRGAGIFDWGIECWLFLVLLKKCISNFRI